MDENGIWEFRFRMIVRKLIASFVLILGIIVSYWIYKLWIIDTVIDTDSFLMETTLYVCPLTAFIAVTIQCFFTIYFDILHIKDSKLINKAEDNFLHYLFKIWYIIIFATRLIMMIATNFLTKGILQNYEVKFRLFYFIQLAVTIIFPLLSIFIAHIVEPELRVHGIILSVKKKPVKRKYPRVESSLVIKKF